MNQETLTWNIVQKGIFSIVIILCVNIQIRLGSKLNAHFIFVDAKKRALELKCPMGN